MLVCCKLQAGELAASHAGDVSIQLRNTLQDQRAVRMYAIRSKLPESLTYK